MAPGGSGQTNRSNNPALDSEPAWSADGQRIAFVSDRATDFEIHTMDADGSSQSNITNNSASDFEPAWSPDGQLIAFARRETANFEVFTMNADGSAQTNRSNNPTQNDGQPAWSPRP